jgi:hypothetical protein
MGMTQDQRRSRRREIAEFVRKGNLPFDAAKRWGVSLATVKTACLENQVPFSTATTDAAEAESTENRRIRGRMKLLRIVAALLNGEDQQTIARREKNSKQYISQINRFAQEAGIFQAVEGLQKKAEEASQLAREAKKTQAREERVEVKKSERLVQLVNAGKTVEEAADQAGVSRIYAYRLLRELGVEIYTPSRVDDVTRFKIIRDLQADRQPADTARRNKVSINTVLRLKEAAEKAKIL